MWMMESRKLFRAHGTPFGCDLTGERAAVRKALWSDEYRMPHSFIYFPHEALLNSSHKAHTCPGWGIPKCTTLSLPSGRLHSHHRHQHHARHHQPHPPSPSSRRQILCTTNTVPWVSLKRKGLRRLSVLVVDTQFWVMILISTSAAETRLLAALPWVEPCD